MLGATSFFAATLLGGADAAQALATQEPARPDLFAQTFEVRCGPDTLRIERYGARLPVGTGPAVVLNGRNLEGGDADRMRDDLMRQGAAYRMTGQCHPGGNGIYFGFNVGERVFPGEMPPGAMRYHRGSAVISGAGIERYTGLVPITEEQFWFR